MDGKCSNHQMIDTAAHCFQWDSLCHLHPKLFISRIHKSLCAHSCKINFKENYSSLQKTYLRMANAKEEEIYIVKMPLESPCIHACIKFSPVLDLIVSLDAVCPIRSYWRRLEDSSGTSTE